MRALRHTLISMKHLPCLLAALLMTAGGTTAWGGGKASALEAYRTLQTRIGAEACAVLVAVHGEQGQDQPSEWNFLTINNQSPNLGQQFAVDQNGVVDRGVPSGLYPSETPPGFIDLTQWLVDSPYAFQLLHQSAVRARVAFNSVDYTLVAREYGKEPVWRLEALDVKGRPVGQVDLSAKSGSVFRTVWYYWDEADGGTAWQGPRIVDSLLSEISAESSGQPRALEGEAGGHPLAGNAADRSPVAEAKEKEKGGLFSRLRRNRPLFGSPSTNPPAPVSVPAAVPSAPVSSPEMAPEAGVAVPVPPGQAPSGPTAEVAPAPLGTPVAPRNPGMTDSTRFLPPNR